MTSGAKANALNHLNYKLLEKNSYLDNILNTTTLDLCVGNIYIFRTHDQFNPLKLTKSLNTRKLCICGVVFDFSLLLR